jgi:acyl carrier protein
VRDRIRELIGTVFGVPVDEVPLDASPANVPGWDSLGHLELMLELENAFGVQVSTEEIPELASLEAIEEFLNDRGTVAAE